MITTENIQREFGHTVALSGINLSVQKGAVFALVGPNGVGKTTLLKIIGGLLQPTSGRAWVQGLDISKRPREVHNLLGYLPGKAIKNFYRTKLLLKCFSPLDVGGDE